MNASVLWDIVSRAKIECHEAADRVRHRAVYRSWCVNSQEPIHGNLELKAVIAIQDLLNLHW